MVFDSSRNQHEKRHRASLCLDRYPKGPKGPMQVTTWESIDDDSVLGPVKQIMGFYNTLNRILWGFCHRVLLRGVHSKHLTSAKLDLGARGLVQGGGLWVQGLGSGGLGFRVQGLG